MPLSLLTLLVLYMYPHIHMYPHILCTHTYMYPHIHKIYMYELRCPTTGFIKLSIHDILAQTRFAVTNYPEPVRYLAAPRPLPTQCQ